MTIKMSFMAIRCSPVIIGRGLMITEGGLMTIGGSFMVIRMVLMII